MYIFWLNKVDFNFISLLYINTKNIQQKTGNIKLIELLCVEVKSVDYSFLKYFQVTHIIEIRNVFSNIIKNKEKSLHKT